MLLAVMHFFALTFQDSRANLITPVRQRRSKDMYPRPMMTNKRFMLSLVHCIVEPVWQANWTACAFRMQWRNDADQAQSVWDNIVSYQSQMDDIIKAVDGISLFVSSITATTSSQYHKPDHPRVIVPALAYWLAVPLEEFNQLTENLFRNLNCNNVGASVKQLVCDNTSMDGISKTLFMVLKDTNGIFIEKKADYSARYTQGMPEEGQHPVSLVWYKDSCISEAIEGGTSAVKSFSSRISYKKFPAK